MTGFEWFLLVVVVIGLPLLIAVVVTLWTLEQARQRQRKNRGPAGAGRISPSRRAVPCPDPAMGGSTEPGSSRQTGASPDGTQDARPDTPATDGRGTPPGTAETRDQSLPAGSAAPDSVTPTSSPAPSESPVSASPEVTDTFGGGSTSS
ncbi:MAG: hypothetical protein AVDCRST_MAG70-2181 [uncultured Thermomicrobiales bacterium]|uniref:Uncharacterized protein n=1 Tax=uncultured Thermomicrobiales bacterium TaxID=1645740 RepID=A0A6J4V7J9_9BACT|nr:MAG: hypothetical protein AVDCRST_MAG70-2181 [uncultured Thermomicrobiales bacterium]